MGKIVSTYIFPHPPLIVPEVGKGGEGGAIMTINSAKKAAFEIKLEKPTTIIITTPHGPVFQDYIYISTSDRLSGNFGKFGSSEVIMEFENNTILVDKIIKNAKVKGISAGGLDEHLMKKYKISKELDHGTLVPLYYINKEISNFKIVHISIAGLSPQELYRFGMCISEAVRESNENVVFIASGDLSHRLSHDAPYGFNKCGREFDEMLINCIKDLDIEKLMEVDEDFCESAGECGLRSFIIMFGAVDGLELKPEVYSYEGPFGVGYSVSRFTVGDENPDRQVLRLLDEKNYKKIEGIRNGEDPYIALARRALETYVRQNSIIKVDRDVTDEMLLNKAGTFVSLKKYGQLRGCIGTTGPTKKNIAEEIIHNAISSGTQDPRFDSVEEDELDKLVYSVDVLNQAEHIDSINELDVIKYGVIVRSGRKSGLLLPNLEGVDTPEKQVAIALQKAGIRQDEKYSMERFEVIRHK